MDVKIRINANSVKHFTGKSYLISIPKSDKCFWLSSKCCYLNRNENSYSIYLNEDYSYLTTKKHSKTTEDVLGEDLIDAFDKYVIPSRTRPNVIVKEHVPDDVKPLDTVVVDNELLRK